MNRPPHFDPPHDINADDLAERENSSLLGLLARLEHLVRATRIQRLAESRARHPRDRRHRRGSSAQRGLTLIEILVTVTIIGIISSIIGLSVYDALETSRVDSTNIQIKQFGDALEVYRMRFHEYPSTGQGLIALTKPPQGRPMIPDLPSDPWGNEYLYLFQAQNNKYDLSSKGPDGAPDTPDDITVRGTNESQMARAR